MLREIAGRRGVGMTEALRQLRAEEEARAATQREAEGRGEAAQAPRDSGPGRGPARRQRHDDDEILGYDDDGIPSR